MEKNKVIANKVFKAVKSSLAEAKKYNKQYASVTGRREQVVEIEIEENDKWDKNGHRYLDSYGIKFFQDWNKQVAVVKTESDLREVFNELINLLNGLSQTKGWGGLKVSHEFESIGWQRSIAIPKRIMLTDAPCSEFKALMNYINKYGKSRYGSSPNLGNFELFSSTMAGKRGYLDFECGERYYLDNKPKRCERILSELRSARGTKDTMVCERGNENYIDPIDREYSAMHEVECSGEKRSYLKVTIKTPNGKVKYEGKLY